MGKQWHSSEISGTDRFNDPFRFMRLITFRTAHNTHHVILIESIYTPSTLSIHYLVGQAALRGINHAWETDHRLNLWPRDVAKGSIVSTSASNRSANGELLHFQIAPLLHPPGISAACGSLAAHDGTCALHGSLCAMVRHCCGVRCPMSRRLRPSHRT